MSKRNVFLGALAVTLLIAGIAVAGPHGMRASGGCGGAMGHLEHLAKAKAALGLSDQQVDQIKAIAAEVHQQNATYRDQLHSGYKSVADTLIANPSNVAAAQALVDQQNAAENAMKVNVVNGVAKALAALTPEQREKVGKFIDEHHAEMAKHGSMHGSMHH
jgi:Spy/CpxP family protein refolding chaperone